MDVWTARSIADARTMIEAALRENADVPGKREEYSRLLAALAEVKPGDPFDGEVFGDLRRFEDMREI